MLLDVRLENFKKIRIYYPGRFWKIPYELARGLVVEMDPPLESL
jgi:hypothetical protein